jgi:outer membrane lipoprotein-sorting protein
MRTVLTILCLLLLPAAATAQDAAPREISAEDRQALQRVEAFLDDIGSLQAEFVQIGPDGSVSTGDFYLRRPGRMRLEYDPPVPYLYVADGMWLTFWDAELEQRSDAPLGSTLADFLVREDVSLSGDVTVTGLRRTDDLIEVDLVQTDDPRAGQLTMVFARDPLRLDRWYIRDGQGNVTQVRLTRQRFGVSLSNDLFRAPRPGFGGRD